MIRALLFLLLPSIALAELRHEDIQRARPELARLTATRSVPKGTGWVEEAREVRTYGPQGHIARHEHRKPDGSIVVAVDYGWDALGRLASTTDTDSTKRVERRHYAYKVDTQGRIVEKVMRDPSKPVGEYYRYEYTWRPDTSHDEVAYRHYPTGGPHEDHTYSFDAAGKIARRCGMQGCSMYEYDAQGNEYRVREQHGERHDYRYTETTYDKANRVATRTIGNLVESFTYNARGDVAEIVQRVIAEQGGAVRAKVVYAYSYR